MSFRFQSALALVLALGNSVGRSVPLAHLQSGQGSVRYFHAPNVVLDLHLVSGRLDRVPLTYQETGQQRRGEIWEAKALAESPKHFLIFTDRFSSNSNVQGECGASPGGERFLHVVSLIPPARETLSMNIDSCYQSITTAPGYPKYDPTTHIVAINIHHDGGSSVTVVRYRIDQNGIPEQVAGP